MNNVVNVKKLRFFKNNGAPYVSYNKEAITIDSTDALKIVIFIYDCFGISADRSNHLTSLINELEKENLRLLKENCELLKEKYGVDYER